MRNIEKKFVLLSFVLSIPCIILSVVNLMLMFSADAIQFDPSFYGWTVAAFALLVTLLIGWNIFTAIDVNSRLKVIEDKNTQIIDTVKSELQSVNDKAETAYKESRCYSKGATYYIQGRLALRSKEYFNSYCQFVIALFYYIQCGEVSSSIEIETMLTNSEIALNYQKENGKVTDADCSENFRKIQSKIDTIITSDNPELTSEQRQKIIRINDEWQDLIKGVAQKEN